MGLVLRNLSEGQTHTLLTMIKDSKQAVAKPLGEEQEI